MPSHLSLSQPPPRAGSDALRIQVIIPCLDEEQGIASVIRDLRAVVPEASILVIDNGSTDKTAERARAEGVTVLTEPRRGKAQAVLSALAYVDADVVVMLDGDGSYPAEGVRRLVDEYRRQPADLITGVRVADDPSSSFRPMHQLGTRAFERVLALVFGYRSRDLFSGLRLFSAAFYQNVPLLSRGFELELELTIQAIDKGFRQAEVAVPFTSRAIGSSSKLRSVRDGVRILRFMLLLLRDYRPMRFFGAIGGAFFVAGLLAGTLPVLEYIRTGLVGRFPLAFLAASLMVIAILTLQIGLIVEGTLRYSREAFQVRLRQFLIERARRGRPRDHG